MNDDLTYLYFCYRNSMNTFFMELTSEDGGEFSNFCRMSSSDFEFLLHKIGPMIEKQQTRLRMPIPAKIRLALTLRYLATGDSYKSLHYLFKVSTPAISQIIPEVCQAINSVLKDQIKVSNTSILKLCFIISNYTNDKYNQNYSAQDITNKMKQCKQKK